MFQREEILKHFIEDCGLYLFPIHSVNDDGTCTCSAKDKCKQKIGKHPFQNFSWKERATNDLGVLTKATQGKNVNFAVATGRKSSATNKYLVVVDVDEAEHAIIGTLPKTFCYRTGSGGYHFWFWSQVPVKGSHSGIAKKVDIKATGGYVIVPPSKHKSGRNYEFIHGINEPIVDLPQELADQFEKSSTELETARKPRKKRASQPPINNIALDWWIKSPVSDLQQAIIGGTKIPDGVRNVTIHRLLSSHRAKGAATYETLMGLAAHYKTQLENFETFDEKELRNIVVSVMRYPVYNTSSENVNKNYCKWREKKGLKSDLEMVEQIDNLFFSYLKPGKGCVSLAAISEIRKSWYDKQGIQEYACYKPQLLASKLRSLGFTRTRTAKSNFWNVEVNEKPLALMAVTCDSVSNRRDEMPTKKKSVKTAPVVEETVVEAVPEQVVAETASPEVAPVSETETEADETVSSAPLGPDGNPLTLLEEREEIITTDRKYNPDDYRFNGMQTSSQEMLMAQIKLFELVAPEQEQDFENGTLIFDEDRTRDFMDALQPTDIIGVKNTMYRFHGLDGDTLRVSPRAYDKYNRKYHFDTPEEIISLVELDNALTMGFGQIMYRNDKPFGLDNEMTYKIRVKVYADNVGRTYVFKSGREIIKPNGTQESTNDNATAKPSA